jgi:hypothetical protein
VHSNDVSGYLECKKTELSFCLLSNGSSRLLNGPFETAAPLQTPQKHMTCCVNHPGNSSFIEINHEWVTLLNLQHVWACFTLKQRGLTLAAPSC